MPLQGHQQRVSDDPRPGCVAVSLSLARRSHRPHACRHLLHVCRTRLAPRREMPTAGACQCHRCPWAPVAKQPGSRGHEREARLSQAVLRSHGAPAALNSNQTHRKAVTVDCQAWRTGLVLPCWHVCGAHNAGTTCINGACVLRRRSPRSHGHNGVSESSAVKRCCERSLRQGTTLPTHNNTAPNTHVDIGPRASHALAPASRRMCRNRGTISWRATTHALGVWQ